MKLSEKWLREWVNPKLSRKELIHKLTMAGLAVEACEPYEDDYVFEFELTPNRGDCLSVLGIAREVAALTDFPLQFPFKYPEISGKKAEIKITIQSPKDCPHYVGCVVTGFTPKITPLDIQKKLKLAGLKVIHPIVDVLNYVMWELGQPLHAFDFDKIDKEIIVRHARPKETITLLNEKNIELEDDVLVIADKNNALALAGVMGGLDSSVTENTKSIFIESAFFKPEAIIGKARRFGLHTDGAHRFERGVDPKLQKKAVLRVIQLLSEIYNNLDVSEPVEAISLENLPQSHEIILRPEKVERLLGLKFSFEEIQKILNKLNISYEKDKVTIPSYRFDITEEVDLIEEIARIYGYENLTVNHNISFSNRLKRDESVISLSDIKKTLIHQGYQEIITYSFISEKSQQLFDSERSGLKLSNPLSAEYAVMRTNLWAGLVETVSYNLNRQQEYLRFFESGLRFIPEKNTLTQESVVSGVWAGKAFPEQWGEKSREVDFFDVKNNIIQLLKLTREENQFEWEASPHPALHPAQTAKIIREGECVGIMGALHPELQNILDIKIPLFLFEIRLDALTKAQLPKFQSFSKFPTVRRDIALIVDRFLEVKILEKIIRENAKEYLSDISIFDVYQGKNLPPNKKSLALGLTFQALDRTMLEDEIQSLMTKVIDALKLKAGALLRE
jgi:phenylalanyl-tRNA synthetase beta chain